MAEHVQHHPASHHSADDQYLETPPGAGYEHTDASVGPLIKFAFWLVVSSVVVYAGLAVMYQVMVTQTAETVETKQYPLAVDTAPRLPAAPRLQQSPENEMYDFRTREAADLNGYGWVDKEAGIVHIPIQDAMRLLLERGLPTRDQGGASTTSPVGMVPSDASSGRVLERRRQ